MNATILGPVVWPKKWGGFVQYASTELLAASVVFDLFNERHHPSFFALNVDQRGALIDWTRALLTLRCCEEGCILQARKREKIVFAKASAEYLLAWGFR